MRVAVEAGARVGEEAGDDAGRGDGLQACLEAAIAEEAARLVFAGGEAAPRCTRVGQGDGHAPAGDGDMAADPAGVVLAPTVGPAVGLAPLRLVVQRQFVDKGLAAGRRRGGCERRSEEHTSELQSLMRISYAVFCLKQKTPNKTSRPTIYAIHNQ